MSHEDPILHEELVKELIHQAAHNMGFESLEALKAACEKMPPASEVDLSLCQDWSDDDFPGSNASNA
jgi:hypothetical protein